MQLVTVPATPTPDGWNVYPKEALKSLAFVPMGTINAPTLINIGGKGYTEANLLSGLLDALKDITDRVAVQFGEKCVRFASACGRNRSTLKLNEDPKWVSGQQLYQLNIVPADQYVPQRKLEKGEKPILDWLFAAQHKGRKQTQDEDDQRHQTVLVRNGYVLTADGWRAHIRPATGPLALADGVYSIKVKGGMMDVLPSDLQWPQMQFIFNGHSPDEVLMRIQAGALRAACKKQEAVCFNLNGLRWQLKAPWVLDALKMAGDGDAVSMSINGIFSGQKGEKNKSVYLSGAGWGAMIMQYHRPLDHYHWTPGKPFPGASQPVTIGGYADSEKGVSLCVQIDRTPMPAVEMLWPEGL